MPNKIAKQYETELLQSLAPHPSKIFFKKSTHVKLWGMHEEKLMMGFMERTCLSLYMDD